MGKRLIQQARGKGSTKYRAPSHRYKYSVKYPVQPCKGVVKELINDPAHTAVIAKIAFESGQKGFLIAPEGLRVNQMVSVGGTDVAPGNVMQLGSIPEGTLVYNLEKQQYDGGKLVRSSGTYATIISHEDGKTVVQLPSKQMKTFPSTARATVGVASGGGRTEKPMLKSGKRFHALQSKARSYLKVSGVSMNVVDHPFGGGQHDIKGRPITVSKNAPPGRKVGLIKAKRTGRK
ncbi:MAG: 50S ribosomal protein L2 [Theionarchaea archaeon]|nr:50S ribosomal protein L2 [Theionarchaea archaeon]MBU7001784.1 50S ribosomal protein L2 [Theionarchaea archaeon]MBU7022267.1 50S ribosomal protein L2 [Theionarchaea archaeon]MBU7035501.1 50S ribosomal protein L2 [Theionarchaea archaeon]MBU7041152.1 50S ribosomal protein L2 [Theionarchaea archaeon]